jgi:hypothetical protein
VKRMYRLLAATVVVTASITGVALGASSPTVITGSATSAMDTSIVLHGRINPNGKETSYLFSYGPTAAYGATSPARHVGAGSKGVNVTQTITGLTPGSVYHYRISALSSAGGGTGLDRTFKTTGHPPAAVVTGPAVNVGKTFATPTGTINPNDEVTTWVIQYGLTAGYGLQSSTQTLTAVNVAEPVSVALAGLSPATLFHYRVLATHADGSVSAGADATFFTEPFSRAKPGFSTRTSPSQDKKSPYQFTTGGTLHGAGFIPTAQRCTGKVGIRYFNGRRQLAFVVAQVGGNCKFTQQATFKRTHAHGPAHLRVTVDFRGNGYLAPVNKTDHVTAG